jgi:hypothetical protein
MLIVISLFFNRTTVPSIQDWFSENNINVLDWPSRSPDLKPIKNFWGLLMKNIQRKNVRPQNVEELLELIYNAWENIENDYCMNLCTSMSRRLREVVVRNGGVTRY